MVNSTFQSIRIADSATVPPEFIRLPRGGTRCPFSSLSRSTLNNLILPTVSNNHRPPVESKILRQPGKLTGVRLIVWRSLMDYLRGLEAEDHVQVITTD